MPELKVNREAKRVVLPASSSENDEAWVEVYTDLRASDILAIGQYKNNPKQAGTGVFVEVIRAWNITIGGQPAPITAENVGFLPAADLMVIIDETGINESLEAMTDAKKKK